MAILRQLLAHAVIVVMTLGGVACLCPADAAGVPAAGHSEHQHGSAAHGEVDRHAAADAGCGHESCGPDCTLVPATSAKSKPLKSATSGKTSPTLDDVAFLPAPLPAWPEAARRSGPSSAPLPLPVRAQESPVRRFDRLLD